MKKIIYPNSTVRDLIALESNGGADGSPRPSAGKYNRWSEKEGRGRKQIADNLYKIKHWKIIHGDYSLAPDINATWFIDPPYNNRIGSRYKCGSKNIDYNQLGIWCQNRKGQVIVCEELLGDWLPFEFLCGGSGRMRSCQTIEAMWTNTND